MRRLPRWLKRTLTIAAVLLLLIALGITLAGCWIIDMPGSSYGGPLVPLSDVEAHTRDRLHRHIRVLTEDLGQRNSLDAHTYFDSSLYIAEQFERSGLATAKLQPTDISGYSIANVQAEITGSSQAGEIIVIGAHYDTVPGSVGANDNGSGVAALIETARLASGSTHPRTLRFVAFYNEERVSPAGSRLYAEGCRARNENIVGMISLETIGYYTDAPDSQQYPFPFNLFYPTTGNFLAFVGNTDSRAFVHHTIGAFRNSAQFPSRGVAAPSFFGDTGRSDHVYFWRNNYPAMMITDTANFRYAHYHKPTDTADKIDYDRLARVTVGLARAVSVMAGSSPASSASDGSASRPSLPPRPRPPTTGSSRPAEP
jgi:Zn-dependent M28 family amino/carboxypeptidase